MTDHDDAVRARRLDAMLDRDEIHQLAVRYSFALDSKDFDGVRALLAPNAVMFGSTDYRYWFKVQRELPDGWGGHFTCDHQIDFVDDTHAQGLCYFLGYSATEGEGANNVLHVSVYVDEYVKLDGRWYFETRDSRSLGYFPLGDMKDIGGPYVTRLADAWVTHRERQGRALPWR